MSKQEYWELEDRWNFAFRRLARIVRARGKAQEASKIATLGMRQMIVELEISNCAWYLNKPLRKAA